MHHITCIFQLTDAEKEEMYKEKHQSEIDAIVPMLQEVFDKWIFPNSDDYSDFTINKNPTVYISELQVHSNKRMIKRLTTELEIQEETPDH